MARIRSIKPDFFVDDDLAKLSFRTRIVFIGLWVHADKEGRLEEKIEKLRVQILPYSPTLDINDDLKSLEEKPFIKRYSIDGKNYIQIINWHKHQRPHHTEPDSIIPKYNGVTTVVQPLDNGVTTVAQPLGREGNGEGKGMVNGEGYTLLAGQQSPAIKFDFEKFWTSYPKRNGNRSGKKATHEKFKMIIKTQQDYDNLLKATANYGIDNSFPKDPIRFLQSDFWKDWIDQKYNSASAPQSVKKTMTPEEEQKLLTQWDK